MNDAREWSIYQADFSELGAVVSDLRCAGELHGIKIEERIVSKRIVRLFGLGFFAAFAPLLFMFTLVLCLIELLHT